MDTVVVKKKISFWSTGKVASKNFCCECDLGCFSCCSDNHRGYITLHSSKGSVRRRRAPQVQRKRCSWSTGTPRQEVKKIGNDRGDVVSTKRKLDGRRSNMGHVLSAVKGQNDTFLFLPHDDMRVGLGGEIQTTS